MTSSLAISTANSGNHIGCGAVALTAAASGQTHLAVDAADPVDHENDLGRLGVDIGHRSAASVASAGGSTTAVGVAAS